MIKLIKALICSLLFLNVQYTQTVSFKNLWQKTKKTCTTIKNKYPLTIASAASAAAAATCFYCSYKIYNKQLALARACIPNYDKLFQETTAFAAWRNKQPYEPCFGDRYLNGRNGPPPGYEYVVSERKLFENHCKLPQALAQFKKLDNQMGVLLISGVIATVASLTFVQECPEEWSSKNATNDVVHNQSTKKVKNKLCYEK